MIRNSFFIFCILLGLLSAKAADPRELHGTVVDADTDQPVSGCIVKSKGALRPLTKTVTSLLAQKLEPTPYRSVSWVMNHVLCL